MSAAPTGARSPLVPRPLPRPPRRRLRRADEVVPSPSVAVPSVAAPSPGASADPPSVLGASGVVRVGVERVWVDRVGVERVDVARVWVDRVGVERVCAESPAGVRVRAIVAPASAVGFGSVGSLVTGLRVGAGVPARKASAAVICTVGVGRGRRGSRGALVVAVSRLACVGEAPSVPAGADEVSASSVVRGSRTGSVTVGAALSSLLIDTPFAWSRVGAGGDRRFGRRGAMAPRSRAVRCCTGSVRHHTVPAPGRARVRAPETSLSGACVPSPSARRSVSAGPAGRVRAPCRSLASAVPGEQVSLKDSSRGAPIRGGGWGRSAERWLARND